MSCAGCSRRCSPGPGRGWRGLLTSGALLAEPGARRSCWQLAEQAGHATPRRLQALLAEHAWDWKAALRALQWFILDHLGDPGAVLVIDETAELKKGQMTVGVARQHAGITGQMENCQTVVNRAHVTGRGHALFDFRLYLPKAWCADRGRRQRAQGPRRREVPDQDRAGHRHGGRAPPRAHRSAGRPPTRSTAAARSCARPREDAGKGYVFAVPVSFKVQLGYAWSAWRRKHQARARCHHYQARLRASRHEP
jgi:DDE superfamily endonuclease